MTSASGLALLSASVVAGSDAQNGTGTGCDRVIKPLLVWGLGQIEFRWFSGSACDMVRA